MKPIEKYRKSIEKLCAKHRVSQLFIFGSVLQPTFSEKSDIDFLVDFETMDVSTYADNYFDFKFSLEELLKKNIDLIERKALRNPFLKEEIEKTKMRVYG
jgi:predicted nucleotidyltransferase